MGRAAGMAALAAAATMVMGVAAAAPASAECKARIITGQRSTGILQTTTEISARAKWRTAVRARYGARYTRWSSAEDKRMLCSKEEPGRRWVCRAAARPCS